MRPNCAWKILNFVTLLLPLLSREEIMSAKRSLEEQLQRHPVILNDLDLLAEIMDEMLETQQVVEVGELFHSSLLFWYSC